MRAPAPLRYTRPSKYSPAELLRRVIIYVLSRHDRA